MAAPLLCVLLVLPAACDSGTDPSALPASLELSHRSLDFTAVGDSVPILAEVRDRNGQPIEGAEVRWESSEPAVATVSGRGVITAKGPGTASVTGSAGDASAAVTVRVEPEPASALLVGSVPHEAPAGETIENLGIEVLDANGHPVAGALVEFTALHGTVDGAGSTATGTDSEGVAGFAWTLPTAAGDTARLHAMPVGIEAVELAVAVRPAEASELRVLSGSGQSASRGEPLPEAWVLRLVDRFENPIGGEPVEVDVPAGSGEVQLEDDRTDPLGEFRLRWTLGDSLGSSRALVRAGGVERTLHAEAVAIPASVVVVEGDGQEGHRALELPAPIMVRVLDEGERPIPGVTPTIRTPRAGGTVEFASERTDLAGELTLRWTLGEAIGVVEMEVLADAAVAVVTATARSDPDTLRVRQGQDQAAPAGSAVADAPTVELLDRAGLPMEGVAVHFEIGEGGGTVNDGSSTSVTTDDAGSAAVDWVLGADADEQSLVVSSTGVPDVVFHATADRSAPATLVVVSGDGQTGDPETTLESPVVVRLLDLADRPVPGVPVEWSAGGDGSVEPLEPETDAEGEATATWSLGSSVGTQHLVVTAGGLETSASAEAAAPPPDPEDGFFIDFDFQTAIDPEVEAVFRAAGARWAEVITEKLPPAVVNLNTGGCGSLNPVSRTVDDLLVMVQVVPIDGPGGTLATAGPCLIRSGTLFPIIGRVRLDQADVGALLSTGRLFDVVLHEIGHVLGIGTMWGLAGMLRDPATTSDSSLDPYFEGPEAIAGFDMVGGTEYTAGPKVPVENVGGAGARNSHWRQSVFSNELMTGWLTGSYRPLSLVTVLSLADLGYRVDPGAADSFAYSALVLGIPDLPGIHLEHDIDFLPMYEVDPSGEIVRVHPPTAEPRY